MSGTRIARVQMPDGQIARLEVPEGTTPQQIESFVFNQMAGQRNEKMLGYAKPGDTAPMRGAPDAIDAGARAAMKPTGVERFGRGFADVSQGAKQGYLLLKDMATGGDEAAAYTTDKSDELARYEAGRGPDAGIDLLRLAGNLVATAPAMAAPGGASMSLLTRMASGAGAGGAASGVMFTPEGESKAGQIALGAGVGGAAPAVLQGGKAVVRKVADWMKPEISVSMPAQAQRIAGELEIKLQQQGVEWNKLTSDVRTSLLEDAQRTLTAGGTLDDVMLGRKALIESVGAKPTRAAVTRSPRDWQAEKNLRGIVGVGDDIVTREQGNAQAMVDYLGKLRAASGGKSATAYEAGESGVKAIQAQRAESEKAVDALYDAYRTHGAQDAAVPATKLADALGKVADEIGTENIPAAVHSRLKEFGLMGEKQTKLLTVNEADKLNRLLNNNNPGHGAGSLAVGRLKTALSQAMLEVAPEGKAGVEALTKARAAAAQMFREGEASKGVAAAIDDVHPDKFVDRFILKAPVRDMKITLAQLQKSPGGVQAIADVKGHLLDSLLLKATGATNLDDVAGKPFSGVKFSKALDALEPEKLHAIYSPAEIESLRALQKASKLLTEEVPFSDVNYSKTASALANLLQKVGSTPLLGQLVSPIIGAGKIGMDWVKSAADRKQVAEIIIGSAGKAGQKAPLPVYQLERAAPALAAGVKAQPSSE